MAIYSILSVVREAPIDMSVLENALRSSSQARLVFVLNYVSPCRQLITNLVETCNVQVQHAIALYYITRVRQTGTGSRDEVPPLLKTAQPHGFLL